MKIEQLVVRGGKSEAEAAEEVDEEERIAGMSEGEELEDMDDDEATSSQRWKEKQNGKKTQEESKKKDSKDSKKKNKKGGLVDLGNNMHEVAGLESEDDMRTFLEKEAKAMEELKKMKEDGEIKRSTMEELDNVFNMILSTKFKDGLLLNSDSEFLPKDGIRNMINELCARLAS
jgi:hypothetical protein